ncbi:MAG: aromatic amino acid ammonia-lyase, partial [Actinomycetota bacterium]|nr:aromatic amino acid ammonia-lyase [Actinomycetota bacterium]
MTVRSLFTRERMASPPTGGARTVLVDGGTLTLDEVVAVARDHAPVRLSDEVEVRQSMRASVALNRDLIARGIPLYGVTTGFGDSLHRQVSPAAAGALQQHLIRFLGTGTGPTTPLETARAVVLLRANNLARGHSAVRVELVERLLDLLNRDVVPVI